MILATFLLGSALLGASPSAEDLAAYRQARSQAGQDADAQVRLALWCEARGMIDERAIHLALAVASDPGHSVARGLRDQVRDGNAWKSADALAAKVAADASAAAALAEYNAKRAKAPRTAEAQWRLALWCESRGLKAEAVAHAVATTRLDPGHEVAWKHLGYKRRDGRWKTDVQIASEKAEARAQAEADRRFLAQLARWRGWLGGSPEKKEQADRALSSVTDPRAVPATLKVFGKDNAVDQLRAVRLLSQIGSPEASRGLATMAVRGATDPVRQEATRRLLRRDASDVVDFLIARLADEIKYEVRPGDRPGSAGELFVEGRKFDLRRVYETGEAPDVAPRAGDVLARDADGLEVIRRPLNGQSLLSQAGTPATSGPMAALMRVAVGNPLAASEVDIPIGRIREEARKATLSSREQIDRDVAALKERNEATRSANVRVAAVLRSIAGKDLGTDREAWRAWWSDQLGSTYEAPEAAPKPTVTEAVAPSYQARAVAPTFVASLAVGSPSAGGGGGGRQHCFAAGTLVRAKAGPRPIEALEAGDLVLSQAPATGELAYRPVLRAVHNPPSSTVRVTFAGRGDAVEATGIHRFWKAGQGWVMARDLRPGDQVRALGGVAEVREVAGSSVQPVYNLEVADGRSFFVGRAGVLVHDISPVESVPRPFDARGDDLATGNRPATPVVILRDGPR